MRVALESALAGRVPTMAIAARRRPGVIFGVWLVEAAVAWVLAAPWSATIARVWGAHPDGDRALWWQPGHVDVAELFLRNAQLATGLASATLVGLAAWTIIGVFPLGALLGALDETGAFPLWRAVARGGALFGRLIALHVAMLLLFATTVVVQGVLPWMAIAHGLATMLPTHAALLVSLAVIVIVGTLAFLTALFDLARAMVVRHDLSSSDALLAAARAPGRAAVLIALSAPRWLASIGAIGFAAAASASTSSVLAIAMVHQGVALARVGLRASVLARALRVASEMRPRGRA